MYLENLNIHGFKSFAKKTKISFKDGVTVIVGPNGCGKSNIVDAIRWVLGEQKAGSIRSERMENVIFNGSRTVKPLGMSEVSMTIHNTRNVLPLEYAEVVITRRLFRSLESQYLLNNNPCRLKDIQDLFMDTGMGSNAYSIIELAMVESLLNGKPEERRHILEEAAGVTKYKLRRRAAFRKLEATEVDLIRVNDIISEVEKNVSSLKRQVRKAQRYQSFHDTLQEKEILLATQQFSKLRSELEPLNTKLKETQADRVQLTTRFDHKEAEIEEARRALLDLERKLSEQQKELNQLNLQIQKKEEQILVDRERRKALEDKKVRMRRDKDEISERLARNREEVSHSGEGLQALFEKIQVAESDYQHKDAELQKMELRIQDRNEQLKTLELQRLRAVEGLSDSKKEEERIKTQLENIRERVAAIDRQLEENELLATIRTDKFDKLTEHKTEHSVEIRNLLNIQKHLEKDIKSMRQKKDTMRENILRKNSELQTLKDRIDLLKKFIESYEDHPEGVQHLLQEGYLNGDCKGTLAENLNVSNTYRRAIETALGEAAVSLIVDETDLALNCIEVLKTDAKGNVTFFPMDRFQNGHVHRADNPMLPKTEGIIDWACNLVECSDDLRPLITSLLEDYVVVKDINSARIQAESLKTSHINLITLNGEVISTWGPIKGGATAASETSIIGRKTQVEELQERLKQIFLNIEDEEKQAQQIEMQYKEAFAKQQEVTFQLKAAQDKATGAEVQIAQLDFESKREREAHERLAEEKQTLLGNHGILVEKSKTITPSLNNLQKDRFKYESEHKDNSVEITKLDEKIKEHRAVAQDSRVALVDLKSEERHLQENSTKLQNYQDELKRSLLRTEEEITSADTEYTELEGRIEANKRAIQVEFEQQRESEAQVHELEDQYLTQKETLNEQEKFVRELRNEKDTVSETFHSVELRVSELEMQLRNVKERIKEEYDIVIKPEPIDENLDPEALHDEIMDIKARLNSMGPVNLLALKEYEKEKERYDFLYSQREDLIAAENNLKDTIKVINKTAREQFLTTFELIRANFVNVFSGFFENGKADLRLDESDDPLEAEVIIEADPKGRRLSALTLLSGGEKTLTAISILFAIYLVKPSPFCILDEVDAPLDDANIARFVNAIYKFSENTQFIIVTHNKLTMRAANCMYGITMEEEGVSKVVSVDFQEMDLN